MKYQNPILSGFHPDPSICRVGEDYYLVTSTFEYFPGIPVYHSRDMLHWEQIGHCLTRNSQVALKTGAPNCINIYAPTIRYHNGMFYVIVTNVTGDNHGNFIVTAKDPAGEWSDPIKLPFEGIDPSLFFDEDGKVYYTGTDYNIYLQQLNVETGEAIGEKHYLWQGTGANNPEGSHLYRINGWYYLLLAQGGTEMCHMAVIARSKEILGPYESCPHNPILTNIGQALPVKAAGHADLVEDAAGNWWAVCLGNRPTGYPFRHIMGRETMLVPVRWEDGWPVCGENGVVLPEFDVEQKLPAFTSTGYVPGSDMTDDFQGSTLHPSWNYIYNPVSGLVTLTGDCLALQGTAGLSEDVPKAWLGRRQEHFQCTAQAELAFVPASEKEEAGLTIYMNPAHHYEIVRTRRNGKDVLLLRRRIGSLMAEECVTECGTGKMILTLRCTNDYYQFSYMEDGCSHDLGRGETNYLSTEAGGCFTGNYIALFASGNGTEMKTPARFTSFSYCSNK